MKKWFFILLALFAFQQRGTIQDWIDPPAAVAASRSGEVILYATDWCGYCARTRVFLREQGIAYQEYDVEKSAEGAAQYRSLNGNGVPLLLVNGEQVQGYDPERILELLGR